jgi:type I restriction enzyme M protein
VLFFDKKPASETPWTKKLWIYDLRTNGHFTLKTKTLQREDLDEFVECYKPGKRHERVPTWAPMDSGSGAGMTTEGAGMTAGEAGMTRSGAATTEQGRWRAYEYDELIARDKVSLDIFWLRDDSLADTDNLPPPGVIAAEIVEDLEAALEQMRLIAEDLEDPASEVEADEA